MPSLITHAVAAAALGQAAPPETRRDRRFWVAAIACSCLPDIDVLGFAFGVPYDSLWGHRGMTHSLAFAVASGVAAAALLRGRRGFDARLAALLSLIAASHGFLDAFTDGGLGIAFFAPFSGARYFFAWRPIRVSPIGLAPFLSRRGLSVLLSEALWVWPPALALGAALKAFSDARARPKPG